jgi:hypothetical protein
MCRQDPRTSIRALKVSNGREQSAQLGWRAGHRRRAERRHPITRETTCYLSDGIATVEHIDPFETVHMHVNKPGHDQVAGQINTRRTPRTCRTRSTRDVHNPIAINHDRADTHIVGQNEFRAADDNHGR